jgi:hypothetical protein
MVSIEIYTSFVFKMIFIEFLASCVTLLGASYIFELSGTRNGDVRVNLLE